VHCSDQADPFADIEELRYWSCADAAALFGVGGGSCDKHVIYSSQMCDESCQQGAFVMVFLTKCPRTCGTCSDGGITYMGFEDVDYYEADESEAYIEDDSYDGGMHDAPTAAFIDDYDGDSYDEGSYNGGNFDEERYDGGNDYYGLNDIVPGQGSHDRRFDDGGIHPDDGRGTSTEGCRDAELPPPSSCVSLARQYDVGGGSCEADAVMSHPNCKSQACQNGSDASILRTMCPKTCGLCEDADVAQASDLDSTFREACFARKEQLDRACGVDGFEMYYVDGFVPAPEWRRLETSPMLTADGTGMFEDLDMDEMMLQVMQMDMAQNPTPYCWTEVSFLTKLIMGVLTLLLLIVTIRELNSTWDHVAGGCVKNLWPEEGDRFWRAWVRSIEPVDWNTPLSLWAVYKQRESELLREGVAKRGSMDVP